MYQTIEAVLENKKVVFENDFIAPNKSTKVLITFLNDENISNIEPLFGSKEVLGTKDHENFVSLLKSA